MAMMTQKTLAVMNTKKRRMFFDFTPNYWAVGVGIRRTNVHIQLGPLSMGVVKKKVC